MGGKIGFCVMGENVGILGVKEKCLMKSNSLEVAVLGFWLQSSGSFKGLKVKKPAEKI